MNLITYRCQDDETGRVSYGYSFAECPEKWIIETEVYAGETYLIVNVMPVSDDFYKKNAGTLKGE